MAGSIAGGLVTWVLGWGLLGWLLPALGAFVVIMVLILAWKVIAAPGHMTYEAEEGDTIDQLQAYGVHPSGAGPLVVSWPTRKSAGQMIWTQREPRALRFIEPVERIVTPD